MNRSEFIVEMYKLGLKVEEIRKHEELEELEVRRKNGSLILKVSEVEKYYFYTFFAFSELKESVKERVYKTVATYSATPFKDREDIRFYLRLKGISDSSSYLNKGKYESEDYVFSNKKENGMYQTVFTPKDVKELPPGLLEVYSCGNLYVEHI